VVRDVEAGALQKQLQLLMNGNIRASFLFMNVVWIRLRDFASL